MNYLCKWKQLTLFLTRAGFLHVEFEFLFKTVV